MNAISMQATTNRTRLETAIARWNAGDLDGYLDLYDDTIRLYGYSPEAMGKQEVEGFYRMIFSTLTAAGEAAPRLVIDNLVESGDRIALTFQMSGRHTGPFMGFAPTGNPYAMGGLTMLRFADGRIVERWSCADMLGLLAQIGAVSLPQG